MKIKTTCTPKFFELVLSVSPFQVTRVLAGHGEGAYAMNDLFSVFKGAFKGASQQYCCCCYYYWRASLQGRPGHMSHSGPSAWRPCRHTAPCRTAPSRAYGICSAPSKIQWCTGLPSDLKAKATRTHCWRWQYGSRSSSQRNKTSEGETGSSERPRKSQDLHHILNIEGKYA